MSIKDLRNFAALSMLSLSTLGACIGADAGEDSDEPEALDEAGAAACPIQNPCIPPPPPPKPNLVPVQMHGGYCTRNASGDLVVRIRNAGTATAGPSHTLVDFGRVRYHRNTPSLSPGQSFDLTVAIPAGCFDPDCHFVIEADENDVVSESNENNAVLGVCIG